MGSTDDFGPDTDAIRAWLSKRATYAKDVQVVDAPRPEAFPVDPSPASTSARCDDVTSTPYAGGAHRAVDSNSAARSVLDALQVDTVPAAPMPAAPDAPDAPDAPAARQPSPATDPVPVPPVRTSQPAARFAYAARASAAPAARAVPPEIRIGRWTEPADNLTSHHASTDVDFPARNGVRWGLSLLFLVVVGATGAATYLAWDETTTATVGIAATLGVLTLVVWGVRASVPTTQLSLRHGQLTIRRGGRREVVDIGGGYTPVAVLGRPGQRRWRVLIERVDLPVVTITPAMVDPHWFTTALYRIRPDLRPDVPAS